MSVAWAEALLRSSWTYGFEWSADEWHGGCGYDPDLWYEALAFLLAERGPA